MEGQITQEHNHQSPAVKQFYDNMYHHFDSSKNISSMKGFHSGDYELDENGKRIIKIIFKSLHSKLRQKFKEYLIVNDIEYEYINCNKYLFYMYPNNQYAPNRGHCYIIKF